MDGSDPVRPFELVVDGDLYTIIGEVVQVGDAGTSAMSKVKGHAHEGLVRDGRVRELDRISNDMADPAADYGRRRVERVIDFRRAVARACSHWYRVIWNLHRFFVAIARAVVNDDGKSGTAPDPLVCCAGAVPKRRRSVEAVREFAMLP